MKELRGVELDIRSNVVEHTSRTLQPFQLSLERLNITVSYLGGDLNFDHDSQWPFVHTMALRDLTLNSITSLAHSFPHLRSLQLHGVDLTHGAEEDDSSWPDIDHLLSTSSQFYDITCPVRQTEILEMDGKNDDINWENTDWSESLPCGRFFAFLRTAAPKVLTFQAAIKWDESFYGPIAASCPDLKYLHIDAIDPRGRVQDVVDFQKRVPPLLRSLEGLDYISLNVPSSSLLRVEFLELIAGALPSVRYIELQGGSKEPHSWWVVGSDFSGHASFQEMTEDAGKRNKKLSMRSD